MGGEHDVKREHDAKLVQETEKFLNTAHHMCKALSQKAHSQRRNQKIVRGAELVVGFSIVLISAAVAEHRLPTAAFTVLSIVGAVFLVLDAALPVFVTEPDPDRFNDYVGYIGRIEESLKDLTIEDQLSSETWNSLTRRELTLGEAHFHDVGNKWPWIHKKMESLGWKADASAS